MSTQENSQTGLSAASSAEQGRQAARRRLLKGGLSVAPVAMTVVSRPVLAGSDTCHGPTGFQSAPPSRVGQTASCTFGKGGGPDAWKSTKKKDYPEDCGDRKFRIAFSDNRLFGDLTIFQAIQNDFGQLNPNSADRDVARKVAAAYLNSLKRNGFPMSTLQVVQLWQGYNSKSYQPGGSGVTWTAADQFQRYLNYVMSA
ncbi:hypothetical protein [Roseateles sp.]|jgi:hypothetical protein|uniref:hypothetical protein n=1 Tax=Roseateles sp. TaxID=1971397 RepID=UPI0037CBC467